ncbi:MAG: low molecular weight protein arginine phosphatase [Firmicutes bacterium]|nr:low molecular weight protein arginine phosphatase [Bacillota bacterium]
MPKTLNVLFVCTGNTCRSVMAKGLFEKMWCDSPRKNINVKVYSAGVGALEGLGASEEALEILYEKGIDLSDHRSTMVTATLLEKADIVFAMTTAQKDFLLDFYPQAKEKVCLLLEYAEKANKGISDPYGRGLASYRKVAGELKEALKKVIAKLDVIENKGTVSPQK